eukprot:272497_1
MPTKKAQKAATAHKKGTSILKKKLIRNFHFILKPTLKEIRSQKYAKKCVPVKRKLDIYRFIRDHLKSVLALLSFEDLYTLLFIFYFCGRI